MPGHGYRGCQVQRDPAQGTEGHQTPCTERPGLPRRGQGKGRDRCVGAGAPPTRVSQPSACTWKLVLEQFMLGRSLNSCPGLLALLTLQREGNLTAQRKQGREDEIIVKALVGTESCTHMPGSGKGTVCSVIRLISRGGQAQLRLRSQPGSKHQGLFNTAVPHGGGGGGSVAQLCLTLCNPMDSSPPGSSVHGILQARTLEWVPFPSPGDLSDPGIIPMSPALVSRFPTTRPPETSPLRSV